MYGISLGDHNHTEYIMYCISLGDHIHTKYIMYDISLGHYIIQNITRGTLLLVVT